MSLHPSEPQIALIEGVTARLIVVDFLGRSLFEEDSPESFSTSQSWFQSGFVDCLFDAICFPVREVQEAVKKSGL